MKLYLMQHGRPVAKEDNPDRPLSDQGEKDAEGLWSVVWMLVPEIL